MRKKIFKFSLISLILAFLVSGCAFPLQKKPKSAVQEPVNGQNIIATTTPAAANSGRLKKFNDYNELAQFLAENNSVSGGFGSGATASGIAGRESLIKTAVPTAAPAATVDSATSGSNAAPAISESGVSAGVNAGGPATLDYSSTNNQVAGVDEADIIKTDGQYIYALVRNELSIIKATPAAEAQAISKITFKSRPQDIFISGNFLAVFGSDEQIYAEPLSATFRRQSPYTFFKVFDVSDPTNPKQLRDLDFEGSYYDARLVGDYVYLLTNTYASYIADEPLVPRVLEGGQVLPSKCDGGVKCFAPEVYYFDIPYDYYNFTNITAINIVNNGEALNGQSYLINNGQNLYVSQNNIYVTYTQYLNEYDLELEVKRALVYPKLAVAEQDKITKIETAADFILSQNEKKYKVAQIIDRYLNSLSETEVASWRTNIDTALAQNLVEKAKEMEKTVIHKIAVNGNKIEYLAMGEVTGQILNQFSMDENGDYFRLATTRSQQWSRLSDQATDSYSSIYVLDANLKLVGSLENLATTERIYAARFLGNRVYLVTFKQTDPLFVISLSNPQKPEVLGAIKVPGFSNYLHPVDQNGTKLLGFGRDTEEDANGLVKVKGLKLSLFDFTDLQKPQELDSYLIGDAGSDSIALSDHKAFLYSAEKNLLSIPAVLRDAQGKLSFGGALVFEIKDNALNLKGRIDHSAGGRFTRADYWNGFGYYDNTVKRSLYIGENLYTFSNKFLKIHDLAALGEIKSLELTAGGDDYIITQSPTIDAIIPEDEASASFPEDLKIDISSPVTPAGAPTLELVLPTITEPATELTVTVPTTTGIIIEPNVGEAPVAPPPSPTPAP